MTEPFVLFAPFRDRVRIRLYDRTDAVRGHDGLAAREGIPLADARQPHGAVTVVVRAGTDERIDGADGLATDVRHIALAVRGADCQIVAVYDPIRHVGGVVHAGWRGLLAGAIPRFIETLQEQWNSDPATLRIGIGPSLCLACSEFTDPAQELPTIDPRFFRERCVDLRGIADEQLLRAGVVQAHIERHPDCTKCHYDRWWSLRGGDEAALRDGLHNALTFSLL